HKGGQVHEEGPRRVHLTSRCGRPATRRTVCRVPRPLPREPAAERWRFDLVRERLGRSCARRPKPGSDPMRIDIAAMTPADWEQVRAIYLEGIASGQATFEVEAPTWEHWDAVHHPFARLVARSGGRVA